MPTPIESRKSWPKTYGKRDVGGPQQAVLERLAELGAERAPLVSRKAYMTTSGRLTLDTIYAQIRNEIEKGVKLGLVHELMREQLGVNRTAYYKIKRSRTGAGS